MYEILAIIAAFVFLYSIVGGGPNEHLPGGDTISVTAVCTIVLSILGRGLSANPLARALAKRVRSSASGAAPE